MVEQLDTFLHAIGPLALLVLGLAATVEYVLPPFPGDSVVLLGGVYAVRGEQPVVLVFLVVVLGSVLGAAVNYRVGAWLSARYERRPHLKPFLGITPEKLHHAEARMRQRGTWLLLINRFLPGIRGLLFVAAGASGMPLKRCLALGAVSAMAHSALLLTVGYVVGGNLERLEAFVRRFQTLTLWLVGLAALALAVRFLARRRSAAEPGQG